MPATYEIDPGRLRIRVEYSGALATEDVVAVNEHLVRDPRVRAGMTVLSDHSRSTTFATPDLVAEVMPSLGRLASHLGYLRVAMVTPRDVQLGMANMAAVYAKRRGIDIRAFRERPEAEAWLDEGASMVGVVGFEPMT